MPANRMNPDEFYAAMAPHDDARLRKVLWTLYWRYWRGNAQLRERIEDELRPQELPKVKAKNEPPDPDTLRILHCARAKPALVLPTAVPVPTTACSNRNSPRSSSPTG